MYYVWTSCQGEFRDRWYCLCGILSFQFLDYFEACILICPCLCLQSMLTLVFFSDSDVSYSCVSPSFWYINIWHGDRSHFIKPCMQFFGGNGKIMITICFILQQQAYFEDGDHDLWVLGAGSVAHRLPVVLSSKRSHCNISSKELFHLPPVDLWDPLPPHPQEDRTLPWR